MRAEIEWNEKLLIDLEWPKEKNRPLKRLGWVVPARRLPEYCSEPTVQCIIHKSIIHS